LRVAQTDGEGHGLILAQGQSRFQDGIGLSESCIGHVQYRAVNETGSRCEDFGSSSCEESSGSGMSSVLLLKASVNDISEYCDDMTLVEVSCHSLREVNRHA